MSKALDNVICFDTFVCSVQPAVNSVTQPCTAFATVNPYLTGWAGHKAYFSPYVKRNLTDNSLTRLGGINHRVWYATYKCIETNNINKYFAYTTLVSFFRLHYTKRIVTRCDFCHTTSYSNMHLAKIRLLI